MPQLSSLWHSLFGPNPRILPGDRHAARLIAQLMLIQAALIVAFILLTNLLWKSMSGQSIWRDRDNWVVLAGLLLILIAFALVRGGIYRPGLWLYLLATAAVPLIAPFVPDPNAEIGLLATAIIPVLLAAIVLPEREVLAILSGLIVLASVQLAVTGLPQRQVGTGFALVVVLGVSGALLLVFRRHFGTLERERLLQIRQSETAVAEGEGRLKALLSNSMDMIVVLDAQGLLRFISGAFERITGHSLAESLGDSALDGVHPEDAPQLERVLAELIRSPGAVRRALWRHQHKDGHWSWLEAVAANCLSVPGVNGVVANIRDVTERERLQERLQQASKMESIGRLAGGVAHDFNNLLTAVLGNLDLAEERLGKSNPARDFLEDIRKAGESAAALTRQLLAFSRSQIAQPRVLDLNQLILSRQRLLTRLLGETVNLRISLAPQLGALHADPGLLEQVIVNLAVNARDAMPNGGTLLIETAEAQLQGSADSPGTAPGHYVLLTVSDTGSGMSDEVKRHLFEPFFTTKPKGRGTGLGLATTYGAVKQSEGQIEVSSEPGKGTCFKIYFPRVGSSAQAEAVQEEASALPTGGETILLVEDDELVRDLAIRVLTRQGYQVLHSSDGEGALILARWRLDSIHLLLTDVVMPGISGRQLAEELVRLHPETRLLFTSGYTEETIAQHGVLERGLHFLGKPYTATQLAIRVREILDRKPG
jgi:two-component system cell cycle sensor histidine kinase/response regulator CckA